MSDYSEHWSKMNPRAKKVWVKALRSGKYKQGKKTLCDTEGRMCCIGVAADVLIDAYWELQDTANNYPCYRLTPSRQHFTPNSGFLDPGHAAKLGLANGVQGRLAALNDEEGYSFAQIADWIEENL